MYLLGPKKVVVVGIILGEADKAIGEAELITRRQVLEPIGVLVLLSPLRWVYSSRPSRSGFHLPLLIKNVLLSLIKGEMGYSHEQLLTRIKG